MEMEIHISQNFPIKRFICKPRLEVLVDQKCFGGPKMILHGLLYFLQPLVCQYLVFDIEQMEYSPPVWCWSLNSEWHCVEA